VPARRPTPLAGGANGLAHHARFAYAQVVGIIAPRAIVHLDNDVVAGLINDQAARDFVSKVRWNGADIYLCPSVVREMCTAPTEIRKKLVEAAQAHCAGFSNLPVADMLTMEIRSLAEGKRVPPIPTLPISRLSEILDDADAAKMKNALSKERRAESTSILDGLVQSLKPQARKQQFEPFMRMCTPYIMRIFIEKASDSVGGEVLKRAADQPRFSRGDKYGLIGVCAAISANVYRRSRGIGKGGGCFTDLPMLVEVSHADILLTRDTELFECSKLVAAAIVDARPMVILVPQP